MARKSAKFNLLLHFKHLGIQLLDALLELVEMVFGQLPPLLILETPSPNE